MGLRELSRASLKELVEMAKPWLERAERACPRTGPGRRPTVADWVLGALIMAAVLKRRKSKSSQYRFLLLHRAELQQWLPLTKFPARSTYFDRYRRAHRLFREAIKWQGRRALREHVAEARCVAVDKSLLEALGPAWHKGQRSRGIVPAGVDRDSTWSYSEHHGWVQGYGLEIVVTAAKNGVVLPLLAGVTTACTRENRTCLAKIAELPPQTRHVLADRGYDTNDLAEAVEWTATGQRTGRRFLCPQVRRTSSQTTDSRNRARGRRRARQRLREARARHFQTRAAQALYRRRTRSAEPLNQWFKHLFQLHDRVWHRGLDNNQTQILTALFCYQLLLRYNHRHGLHHAQLQWILDGL